LKKKRKKTGGKRGKIIIEAVKGVKHVSEVVFG
jgi:hypothetical protein